MGFKEDKKEEADQLQRSKRYYAEGVQISGGMYYHDIAVMIIIYGPCYTTNGHQYSGNIF